LPGEPFAVELGLIPVRDEVIREINPQRYLVPDKVYDGPNWGQLDTRPGGTGRLAGR
jgi:hypothetical protein